MSALRDDAPVFAGGRVGLAHRREVERRALLHPRRRRDRHPAGQVGDDDRTARLRVETPRPGEVERDALRHAALVGMSRHGNRDREVLMTPGPVALHRNALRRGEADGQRLAVLRRQPDFAHVAPEKPARLAVGRERDRLAVHG